MKSNIEDFNTGWYGISLGLTESEIDDFIAVLQELKSEKTHFHYRSDYEGNGGIGDIEVYVREYEEPANMELEPSVYASKSE
ncbi:MAG: hypothetical protein AAF385_17610 [Pseudomonadota bacterium]